VQRILQYFAALADTSGRDAGTLSGGEQQMVAIGRGLMARPQLLMIDEPSFGLAPKIVDRVMEIIKAINRGDPAVRKAYPRPLVAANSCMDGVRLGQ
jgi:branched-chain amino acid transport system ATP-binding protein